MAGKLVACPSCAEYVRMSDSRCPHCDAQVHDGRGHVLGRTAGAVLMGLALTACPASDDTDDTAGSSAGSSSSTSAGTNPTSGTTDPGSTTSMTDPSAGITAAAYGNPDTGDESQGTVTEGDTTSSTGGDTDTDTDTDGTSSGTAGSTSISPDYGVPPTTGE